MDRKLASIDTILDRLEHLTAELLVDPDGHVQRSAQELRSAFGSRHAMEPAVARLRGSIDMLRRNNQEGTRKEFQRRAHGLDHLESVVNDELIPALRRMGFEL